MIRLRGSTPPAEQIQDQIRGLISAGRLAADAKLPSVRQLAKDLDVAPGTVAKAYKALETEGILVTKTAGGTRVSASASAIQKPVLDAAQELIDASIRSGASLDDAVRAVRAIWPT